ncbi:UPF0481 protein At3g47200 [Quercus suber]|uniref:Upf0481 protein n=1 Tax=Quercus suber TaxID=58331 RepID=A0AAW0LCU5_QUESU|nr:UPF0481 protein At3g47200-like [Quercus suber]POE92932.1 upf0481 protein [Quercus suber]
MSSFVQEIEHNFLNRMANSPQPGSTGSTSTSTNPSWVVKLVNDYEKEESFATPRYCPTLCTMFPAPTNMRQVNEHAYDPVLVSIGPFHYKKALLQGMEEHKLQFLFRTMRCQSKEEKEHRFQRLAEAMKKLERRARQCYSETFEDISSDCFVRMMVIDGCFILELFRYYLRTEKEIVDDPIFRTRWKLPVIRLDLVKLENQLPFFVLQELYMLTSLGHEPPLIHVALKFLHPLLTPTQRRPIHDPFLEHAPDHLLALFHSTFNPKENLKIQSNYGSLMQEKKCLIPSVRELQRVGIFLKSGEGDLLDIKYHSHYMTVLTGRALLEIPPLFIDYKTGPILRNLVAYEQCDKTVKPYFTSYIMFFDGLVNTPEDIQILRKKKIFYHVLGSDNEVSELLNDLTKDVAYDWHECYLAPLIQKIYLRSNKAHLKIQAAIRREYFSSPVNCISYLITFLLLYLTVIQTMFTVIAFIRQRP